MRLSLFAGLAALGARAVDFDDDDINFLRMLQSNASGNATATTVPPAVNTTVPPVATTVPPAGNTTVAPATTVPSGNATQAADTTVPVVVTTVPPVATTAPPAAPSDLCLPATYTAHGFATPAASEITQQTHVIGITGCMSEGKFTSADNSYLSFGADSQTTANKDKCGSGAKDITCAASNADLNTFFAGLDHYQKGAVLGRCCGKYPSDLKSSAVLTGTLKQAPSVTMGRYTDAECATAAAASALEYPYQAFYADGPKTFSGCLVPDGFLMETSSGLSWKISACNSTATSGANRMSIMEQYLTSDCSAIWDVSLFGLPDCASQGSGNNTVYAKATCSGGSAVTDLEINNDYELTFASLPANLATADQSSILSLTCDTLASEQDTKSGAADATTTSVQSCVGTGNLGSGVYSSSSRRVRRLSSHETKVKAVIKSVVPVAQADTVKAAMSGGSGLTNAGVATAVVAALQADSALASVVGNITATASVTVNEPVIAVNPSGGGGGGGSSGSTSGAVSQFLGMGAALLLGAALFI